MVATPPQPVKTIIPLEIKWEKPPEDFRLEEKPVENTAQPLIAGALRESLELANWIKPEMLIASNFGLCATVNGKFIIKAPDWVYVASVNTKEQTTDHKSYTANLEGETPSLVMEFLSDTEGEEYSIKPTYPPGKWYFYEKILSIPTYVIFAPITGVLEVYHLTQEGYEISLPDQSGHYFIPPMNLFLGVWQGKKEERIGYWLRWWDHDKNVLPWGVEKIEHERQRAEQERQRADQERQRAEKLAAYLRSQGINPDDL